MSETSLSYVVEKQFPCISVTSDFVLSSLRLLMDQVDTEHNRGEKVMFDPYAMIVDYLSILGLDTLDCFCFVFGRLRGQRVYDCYVARFDL